MAMESMATLNANAATLLRKYGSRGATDVTGFGILGHAKNLAAAQVSNVDLVIKKLPVITNMAEHVESMPDFKVSAGYSAETSGGIMAMLEASKADDFIAELEQDFGQKAWIIGEVTNGQKEARIAPDVEILSLSDSFMLK